MQITKTKTTLCDDINNCDISNPECNTNDQKICGGPMRFHHLHKKEQSSKGTISTCKPKTLREQWTGLTTYSTKKFDSNNYNLKPNTVTLSEGKIIEVNATCTGCKKKCYIANKGKMIPREKTSKNSWEGNKNESPVAAVLYVKCSILQKK